MKAIVIIFVICSLLYMIYILVDAIIMAIKFFKYKEMDIFEKNIGKLMIHYLIANVITLIAVSGLPGYLYHL